MSRLSNFRRTDFGDTYVKIIWADLFATDLINSSETPPPQRENIFIKHVQKNVPVFWSLSDTCTFSIFKDGPYARLLFWYDYREGLLWNAFRTIGNVLTCWFTNDGRGGNYYPESGRFTDIFNREFDADNIVCIILTEIPNPVINVLTLDFEGQKPSAISFFRALSCLQTKQGNYDDTCRGEPRYLSRHFRKLKRLCTGSTGVFGDAGAGDLNTRIRNLAIYGWIKICRLRTVILTAIFRGIVTWRVNNSSDCWLRLSFIRRRRPHRQAHSKNSYGYVNDNALPHTIPPQENMYEDTIAHSLIARNVPAKVAL